MDFSQLSLNEKKDLLFKAKLAYYDVCRDVDGAEEILTDEEYDILEDLISIEDAEFEFEVGTNSRHNKAMHTTKMLSLGKHKINSTGSNTKTIIETVLTKFGELELSWKYDGLAMNVEFENSKLKQIVTRGNGHSGVDRTAKLRHIIDNSIEFQKYFEKHINGEIRCECVVSFSTFNQHYQDKAHPRNVASGLVGDENLETGKHHLELIVLEGVDKTGCVADVSMLPNYKVKSSVIRTISAFETILAELTSCRTSFEYPTDGLVATKLVIGKELTHNGHYPNHAIAIKFTPPAAVTTVTKIEWNLQKTGRYTPIVHFEPFIIDGRSISKASGHNLSWLVDRNIYKGQTVKVELMGDIIPSITKA